MNKKFKISAIGISLVIAMSALSSCGGKKSDIGSTESNLPKGEVQYPIKTDVTLKYWTSLNSNVSQIAATMNDTEFAAEEYKKTGIKVEYIHPAQGQEDEKFNLLLSSGDLPDIINWNWYGFSGGPDKAISDGYIMRLNDIMQDYAPNMTRKIKINPNVDKMVKTDMGSYYVFPTLKLDDPLLVFYGPMMRGDWLKELDLEVPETIDEWYTVLKAFKEKKGADAPLSYLNQIEGMFGSSGALIGAFDAKLDFYMSGDKVKYGPIEPGYKEFVKVMSKWYSEGLIDKNIAAVDVKALDAKILNGNTGATFGYNGSNLGKWLGSNGGVDGFDLTAVPYPVLNKGETPKFGQKDQMYSTVYSAGISAKSKNKELAARFLDYAYGDEGHMLYNFGIEGDTYNMVDGNPVYTDKIMKNPDKLSIANALAKYAHASYEGPFQSDIRYFMQFYPLAQQKNALEVWAKTDAGLTNLPRIVVAPEESAEFNSIMTEIKTMVSEKTMRFIMCVEPIENVDSMVAQIKNMNIDRAMEIQQKALERYNNR